MITGSISKLRHAFAAWATALLLAACGGGGTSAPPAPGATASVSVTVLDTFGRAVASATVSSGTDSASTGADGRASIAVPTGSEQALEVRKAGFAEQIKIVHLPSGTTAAPPLRAMLVERAAAVPIAGIEAGGSATGVHGVKVTFPAGALVTPAGAAVSGTIDMRMTPVDVSGIDVGAFPGLFEGLPTGGARAPLLSFGVNELVPEQGGQKLNLAPGKTAEIELPIYADRLQDGTPIAIGSTIALWSLDTTTGLWTQEGLATVVASAASPTGVAARATISHFSWWNLDAVAARATVDLTVVPVAPDALAGKAANISAEVVAGSGPAYAATEVASVGTARAFQVPASGTVTRFTALVETDTQSCSGSVTVSPAADSRVSANIVLTSSRSRSDWRGRPARSRPTRNARWRPDRGRWRPARPGRAAGRREPGGELHAAFFYRGFWDSSAAAEGVTVCAAGRPSPA